MRDLIGTCARAFAIVCVIFLALPTSAQMVTQAQTQSDAVALPSPLTTEAATALISRLSDTQVRALLLDQLKTQATEETAASQNGMSDLLYHATAGALDAITTAIERFPMMIARQGEAFATFSQKLGSEGIVTLFGLLALAFGAAYVAELVFRRLTTGWHVLPPPSATEPSLRDTLKFLFQRLCGAVLAVLVFVAVARTIGRAIMPLSLAPYATLVGFYLIGLPRIALAVGRFLLAPDNPAYRLVHTDDRTATALMWHQGGLALLIGFSTAILQFNELNGVTIGETRLGFWLNLAVHVYVAVVIWRYRSGLTMMMRGADPDVSRIEDGIARAFPYFGIAVSLGMWWVVNIVVSRGDFQLLATAPHYKTMVLLLFAPSMDTLIRGLVRHLAPDMTGEGVIAERAYASTRRSYIRIGRVLVFGLVLILIARIWGMTPASIATAGVGERFAASLIEFLMILSIGYLVYEIVSLWINRKLAAEQTASGLDPGAEEAGGEGGGAGGSRLSTVLPLVLGVARATIAIVFLLLALGNVGIDTTPLLAGAGIVGLAIGFGAQKLVTDVVSGIFFLIDDAFRTGEYVEVDGTMGTVEKISIRSMQLRHHKGPVHTIPYGEIPKLTNFSRDWVIMKLRFTVPFGTDPNKVKKIFKKIGQDMMEVPEFADDFLQPFKSQGVFEIDDVGMVIRGKFMAKPGKQFVLRKEIFNRVSSAFAENGIEFARREVRVAIPGLDHADLDPSERTAVAAAATQAAQEMAEEQGAAPPKPGD